MTIEGVRKICKALPEVTEDVKWGHNLCFSVGGKMFAAMDLNPPHALGFKCTPDAFAELVERPGIIPAPYLARARWVLVEKPGKLRANELGAFVRGSYELVRAKLTKTLQRELAE